MSNFNKDLNALKSGLQTHRDALAIAGRMQNEALSKLPEDLKVKALEFQKNYATLIAKNDYAAAALLVKKFEEENK